MFESLQAGLCMFKFVMDNNDRAVTERDGRLPLDGSVTSKLR